MFFKQDREEQARFIEQALQNQQWKQLLLGSIIEHFPLEELDFYEAHK